MDNLDQLSRSIGRVEGAIDSLASETKALFAKLDKVNEEVIEQKGQIKLLASQSAEMKPAVEDFKNLKAQGKGALFGISLVSGSFGAGLATIISRFTGHGS